MHTRTPLHTRARTHARTHAGQLKAEFGIEASELSAAETVLHSLFYVRCKVLLAAVSSPLRVRGQGFGP